MFKNSIYIFLIWFSLNAYGQKETIKTFDAAGIENILIDASNIYNVNLIAHPTNVINIKLKAEGEYSEFTVLEILSASNTLTVKSGFSPYYKRINDKLAAHKVQAVALEILIPTNLFVSILSMTASVESRGSFAFLDVKLDNGFCSLVDFVGEANVSTNSGDILVQCNECNFQIEAKSVYGKVHNELINSGNRSLKLTTTRGDIVIEQTK